MRLNDCDPGFKQEIARQPGGAGIKACFTCAACTSRCPVGALRPEYDPRRLIRLAVLGRRQEVLSSPLIWLCSSCHNCSEVCPQQVSCSQVLTAIKNLAAQAGCAPSAGQAMGRQLAEHGRLLAVSEFENDKRAELGLPPVSEEPADYQAILGIKPAQAEPAKEGA